MFLRCCLFGLLVVLSAEANAATFLTVTADSVELTGEATNDRLRVDVLNGNRLKIRSLNSQMIILNGVEANQHIITLVPSLEADLRGGADFLQLRDQRTNAAAGTGVFGDGVIVNLGNGRNSCLLDGINLGGDFYFQGGRQRDDVGSINNSSTAGNFTAYTSTNNSTTEDFLELGNVGGDLEVGTGAGDDGVIVSGYVGGQMRIFTEDGLDQVRIGPSLIGEAVIDTGEGDDTVETRGAWFLFNTFVTTAGGSDRVAFFPSFDDPQNPLPTVIDGDLYVDAGDDVDDVQIDLLTVNQFCQIDLGFGANGLTIDDSTFNGDCTFRTQEGGGVLNIERLSTSALATTFNGVVAVEFAGGGHVANLGTGTDQANLTFQQDVYFFGEDPISTLTVDLVNDPFQAELFLFGWELAP